MSNTDLYEVSQICWAVALSRTKQTVSQLSVKNKHSVVGSTAMETQGPTPQHLPFNVFPDDIIEYETLEFLVMCHLVARGINISLQHFMF